MSVFLEIEHALEARLELMTGLPDVAWPNSPYTPDANKVYLRVTHLAVPASRLALGDDDSILRAGFVQIDVCAPVGKGKGAAYSQADAIRIQFNPGLELFTSTDGYKVRIHAVSIDSGEVVGSHYMVPVLINYTAVTKT